MESEFPALMCTGGCQDPIQFDGVNGYRVFACSGRQGACANNFYHAACLENLGLEEHSACLQCGMYQLEQLAGPMDRNPVPVPGVGAETVLLDRHADDGERQVANTCYASATAAALRWGPGLGVSIWDCMNDYMMSDAAPIDVPAIAAYRGEVLALRGQYPNAPDRDLLGYIDEEVFQYATRHLGSPIFPQGISAVFIKQRSMSDERLIEEIRQGKAIMAAQDGNHWIVIFGCVIVKEVEGGKSRPHVQTIKLFDPGDPGRSSESWAASNWDFFYSIGR